MTRQENLFLAELIGNRNDVVDEFGERVGGNAGGFAAQVVAALVGYNDAKSSRRERLDLSVPPTPKFREAVEKYDDRAVFRAGGDGVQTHGSVLERQSLQRQRSGAPV